MQMALEALEILDKVMQRSPRTESAITALRAALAEPEQDDPALDYCHRFAILMECVMLGGVDKHWNEMGTLLDEYNAAQHKWREAHGEPYVSGFGKD